MDNFKETPAYKIGRFIFMIIPLWILAIPMEMVIFPLFYLTRFIARLPLWLVGYWWCTDCQMTMKPKAHKHKLRDYTGILIYNNYKCCSECSKESRGEVYRVWVKKAFWRKYLS